MRYDPGIEVAEHPDVYPPSEDSELLIESLDVVPGERVLEIGCGSGVVSMHCAANGASVTCADINPTAVELVRIAGEIKAAGCDRALIGLFFAGDCPAFEIVSMDGATKFTIELMQCGRNVLFRPDSDCSDRELLAGGMNPPLR